MANAGEDGDVSKETLESWNERVREITRGWNPENVWNMDETGSFWRGLPDTSLNEKGRRCRGRKQAKQRRTWAFFVGSSCDAEVFIFAEDSIDVCSGNIDKTNPNWRNEIREQIIDDEDVMLSAPAEKQDRTNEEEEEDEFDPELKQPVIKTIQKAEEVAEQLKDFAQFNGHEELSLALSKVSDLLHQIKLRSLKLPTTITDFFTSC